MNKIIESYLINEKFPLSSDCLIDKNSEYITNICKAYILDNNSIVIEGNREPFKKYAIINLETQITLLKNAISKNSKSFNIFNTNINIEEDKKALERLLNLKEQLVEKIGGI